MSKNPKISNKPSWPIWIHWHPKGCMTLEVWLGIIIKSNPISYVLWHTRMVTCELCPPIMKRCLFSLDISYMLPMCTKKWITHHYMSPTKKWITCHQVFLCMAISPTYNFITWVHPYLFFNKLGVHTIHLIMQSITLIHHYVVNWKLIKWLTTIETYWLWSYWCWDKDEINAKAFVHLVLQCKEIAIVGLLWLLLWWELYIHVMILNSRAQTHKSS